MFSRNMNSEHVNCPTCGEEFAIPGIAPEDFGQEIDYDCEICCRPMIIEVGEDGSLSARALGDSSFS